MYSAAQLHAILVLKKPRRFYFRLEVRRNRRPNLNSLNCITSAWKAMVPWSMPFSSRYATLSLFLSVPSNCWIFPSRVVRQCSKSAANATKYEHMPKNMHVNTRYTAYMEHICRTIAIIVNKYRAGVLHS